MAQTARDDALAILRAGIQRVDPYTMVRDALTVNGSILTVATETERFEFDLSRYSRIVVTGAGKATAPMARGIESILGDRISGGVIAIKAGHGDDLETIRSIEGGHPVPDEGSIEAARAVLDLAETVDESTLVLNLISGGGSALLTLPYRDSTSRISLDEMRRTTSVLLSCGATIQEINSVRKHISAIKGGRIAEAFAPATVMSLILSDVVGDDLSSIASGITAPDVTTWADADRVFRKYGIEGEVPEGVAALVERGLSGGAPETPKPDNPIFDRVYNVLLGSNPQALAGAYRTAVERGYNTVVLTSQITGEAREVAKVYAGIARDLVRRNAVTSPLATLPACVIAGGETTVTIRGSGKGGRNQEMAVAFLAEFFTGTDTLEGVTFLSGATDGNDGPTDAAGGFADDEALSAFHSREIDPMEVLAASDAYHALEATGALVKTGPTNTNVCDIQVLLVR
ncbi:MAG: glycerate kinase type-2 family protein [Alkalispirochaeta sp.]